jgi:hypothetical protein
MIGHVQNQVLPHDREADEPDIVLGHSDESF